MSLSIMSSWIFVEKRKLFQVFPEPLRILWSEWELRAMVLVSLALQVVLVLIGNRRKYVASLRLRIFTWCAYLMADWVATFALGIISNNNGRGNELMVLWAPFLLLHLGGPETITAFSFADNELWIRHLLGVIVQTLVTVYVIVLSWQTTWLSFLTLPMLLVGTIKFAERSWVLKSASRDQFRYSSVKNYEKSRIIEVIRSHAQVIRAALIFGREPGQILDPTSKSESESELELESDSDLLLKGHSFFKTFKVLFVDLMLGDSHGEYSQTYFIERSSSKNVFKVIEIELGFAYDTFYTKAPISYTREGIFSRFLTSSLTVIVFVMFSIIIVTTSDKYSSVDMVITFILFVGAIILETYAFISLLCSDWTEIWLSEHSQTLLFKVISCLRFHQKDKSRWSKSTSQYNLLSYSLNQMRKPTGILGLVPWQNKRLVEMLENARQLKVRTKVSDNLEDLIYTHFLEKSLSKADVKLLCTHRGGGVLEKYACLEELRWTTDMEFDHSILIWHVATDLCYSSDIGKFDSSYSNYPSYKEISKQLADYLLYLLVMCPFCLPIGIGMLRFEKLCSEAVKFVQGDEALESDGNKEAYRKKSMQLRETIFSLEDLYNYNGDSVLRQASRLANYLQTESSDNEKKWKMVSNVWVEMLGYAANKCSGFHHAENLANGGELLTRLASYDTSWHL